MPVGRVAVTGGHGYLLAGQCRSRGIGKNGCTPRPARISPEYRDLAAASIAARRLPAARIETCLFIGPAHDAGRLECGENLFAADALGDEQRRMLLSGKSTDGLRKRGTGRLRLFRVSAAPRSATPSRRAHAPPPRSGQNSRPAPIAAHAFRIEAADRADRFARSGTPGAGGGE